MLPSRFRSVARHRVRRPVAFATAAALVCGALSTGAAPALAAGNDGTPADPAIPPTAHEALTALPPGNSMFYPVDGQAKGTATGNPGDFGDHVDDQREMYWNYRFKDGEFHASGTPQQPRAGVKIYWDDYGVPTIVGDTGEDVWFGAGYAVAQLRLFLIDAIRRTARGTMAELTGPDAVPADIQQRVLTYSEDEYQAMFDRLSPAGRDAVVGYADGVNAWIDTVMADPSKLPAEYTVLNTTPQKLTPTDVLAAGVLITRTVASEGGNEFENVKALRALEQAFGKEAGRGIFKDLVWQEDAKATTTIPRSEGTFSSQPVPPGGRDAVFTKIADWADTLPLSLADGPGTGDAPVPSPTDAPTATVPSGAPAAPAGSSTDATRMTHDSVAQALEEFRAQLSGGSFVAAVAPKKTADGHALLVSEPQLGYNPTLLVELEVHGAGYNARGVSVPGLPTVGIGYTDRVAWALTTGNSKTIDSYVETVRTAADGTRQYRHDGAWHDMDCRTEAVHYRQAVQGVPVGPAAFTDDVQICRTVHGPVVATSDDGTMARSVQYAMWDHEVDTVEGILDWNRAKNLDDFRAAMRKVTWNENTGYADADGHIAFWHPGRYPKRSPETDQRFPIPGTGAYDNDGYLPFDQMPHMIDPAQGYLANWNTKPAHGWLDGVGIAYASYPAGRGQRVTTILDTLASRDDWTFDGLRDLDRITSRTDTRARAFLPMLLALRHRPGLTDRERAALDVLAGWNRSFNADQSEDGTTVGAAPTIFDATLEALYDDLFGDLHLDSYDLVARQRDLGRHHFDMGPVDNLALRILDPSASSLTQSRDYTGGRSRDEVLQAALATALDRLARDQGDDVTTYTSSFPQEAVCSPTGGIIGPCVQMPFVERGTWIHLVGFTQGPGDATPGEGTAVTHEGRPAGGEVAAAGTTLPTTGSGSGTVLWGLALLVTAGALRRRRVGERVG